MCHRLLQVPSVCHVSWFATGSLSLPCIIVCRVFFFGLLSDLLNFQLVSSVLQVPYAIACIAGSWVVGTSASCWKFQKVQQFGGC